MQNHKTYVLTAGVVVIVAIGGLWYASTKIPTSVSPAPVATTSNSLPLQAMEPATTTPASPSAKSFIAKFPINPADTIASWSFKGAYAGNDALIAQANADITKLTDLIGKGKYDDYDLYNGIANDYSFLGDGKVSYQNYNRAISIHPKKGLAYANLGHLMDGLGAYHTAADAYAKAVAVEPSVSQYKNAQFDFLTWRFPEEAARLKAKQ